MKSNRARMRSRVINFEAFCSMEINIRRFFGFWKILRPRKVKKKSTSINPPAGIEPIRPVRAGGLLNLWPLSYGKSCQKRK